MLVTVKMVTDALQENRPELADDKIFQILRLMADTRAIGNQGVGVDMLQKDWPFFVESCKPANILDIAGTEENRKEAVKPLKPAIEHIVVKEQPHSGPAMINPTKETIITISDKGTGKENKDKETDAIINSLIEKDKKQDG